VIIYEIDKKSHSNHERRMEKPDLTGAGVRGQLLSAGARNKINWLRLLVTDLYGLSALANALR